MKILDDHGRLFGKVSILDVLVAILAVTIVSAAVFVKRPLRANPLNAVPPTVLYAQFAVREMNDYVLDDLQVGDQLYLDDASLGAIGEVLDIQATPGTALLSMDDGTLAYVEHPGTYNVLVTTKIAAAADGNIYKIGGKSPIALAANRNLHTHYVLFTGFVSYLSTEEPDLTKPFDLDTLTIGS